MAMQRTDDMRIDMTPEANLLCACCGLRLRPEGIEDDVICSSCMIGISEKELPWVGTNRKLQSSNGGSCEWSNWNRD